MNIEFRSILFNNEERRFQQKVNRIAMPDFFTDLNLDQVINSLTAGKEEYNLKPFYYKAPVSIETIEYRQQVMKDIESDELLIKLESFAEKMRDTREQLASVRKLYYKYQRERLHLDIVADYCDAIKMLETILIDSNINSLGLKGFRAYIQDYTRSDRFISLVSNTREIIDELSSVSYTIHIDGLRVEVSKCNIETDYSAEVEKVFAKFKRGAVKSYLSDLPSSENLTNVEAEILDGVAQLYPDYFNRLDEFVENSTSFQDELIADFDREIQFYIAYLKFINKFKVAGLLFCYPQITSEKKEIYNYNGFDLALANNLLDEKSLVVANDFSLKVDERVLVVSGPNQGGKTTFARSFGQIHYLASIGCPVPGSDAKLFLYDRLFTHFEREENMENLRGKLQDELVRIHRILEQSTTNSIIIINEIFTSTTLQDQIFLSRKIMKKISSIDILGVWVTFIDGLGTYNRQTVSMVSTVLPEDSVTRTFKIIRKASDGLAYAHSIAEKYKLTYQALNERLKP